MKKFFCLIVLLFPMVVLAAPAPKQKPIEPDGYIRLIKDGDKVESLQIAITSYEDKDKTIKVDLVGVVHIGDASYYKELNKRLAKYDVVLYELVAPEGTKPKQKQEKNNLASMMPQVMSLMLDLEMQLSVVNYEQKNFVHADMSFEEMKVAMEKRGETGLTLGLSAVLDSLKQQAKKKNVKEVDLSQILENPNLLKQQMAQQMVDGLDGGMGDTMKKLIVDDRNKKACDVLDKQIAAGKKSIAIFYGAAHNEDFDKRLRKDRKMVCVGQEWLTAWGKLTDDPVPMEIRLMKVLMKIQKQR